MLNARDPRRYQPLVDFCIKTALAADFQSGSAFDLARRVQLVRSVLRCLQWRFNAWIDDFVDFYFRSITCPYAEVRNLIASVLNGMDQIQVCPHKGMADVVLPLIPFGNCFEQVHSG
jgi:proteasome activator subunit 4